MDRFNETLRHIGMMLMYGQTIEEIHDVLMPEDEGEFFLLYMAAVRWCREGVASGSGEA